MKNLIALSIVFILFTITTFAQTFSWTQKASFMPGNRAGAFSFSIGNKGYVGSGVTQMSPTSIAYIADFWEYDPSLDAWTQMASYPTAVSSPAAFSIDSLGYVTTGYSGIVYSNQTYAYDPATNNWTPKANFPGAARYTCSSFVIGNDAYVGMGKGGPYYTDFYKYNSLTDSWTAIASIGGNQRQNAKTFTIGNYGYVIGGAYDASGDYFDNWQYDPAFNAWTQKANYPGSGSFAGIAFAINGLGYLGCGSMVTASSTFNDFFSYDAISVTWLPVANFGGGNRNSLSYFVIGNKGYAGLGSTDMYPIINYQNDWWEFSVPTAITTNDDTNTINVYANATVVTVQLQNASKENYTLKVFDIHGKIICNEIIYAGTSLYKTNLNVSKGNYMYEVSRDNEKIKAGKFLIE